MWEAGEPLQSAWAEFAVLFDRAAQIPVSTHPTKGIRFSADDLYTDEPPAPTRRSAQAARRTSGTKKPRARADAGPNSRRPIVGNR